MNTATRKADPVNDFSDKVVATRRLRFGSDVLHILGSELYRTYRAALWELWRNGLVACMPNGWDPSKTHLECDLVTDHVLGVKGKRSMTIFDKGAGIFSARNFERFFDVARNERETSHAGASQKGIGRLAYQKLGKRVHYLSRDQETGAVWMLTQSVYDSSNEDLNIVEISPNDSRLGKYAGYKGTFTLIVIPAVEGFKSTEQIAEQIRRYLPVTADQAVKIILDGKPLAGPVLPKRCLRVNGLSAYLDIVKKPEDLADGGIWLCDGETHLPVAKRSEMGQHVPYPLGQPMLTGYIILENRALLDKQDASRGDGILRTEYLKSAEWNENRTLLLQAIPLAKELIGDSDVFDFKGGVEQDLAKLIAECKDVWQLPKGPTDKPVKPGPNRGPADPEDDILDDPDHPDPKKRIRGFKIVIDGVEYTGRKTPLPPNVIARVSQPNQMDVDLDPKKFPGTGRREFFLMILLAAHARYKNIKAESAMQDTVRLRLEFDAKKRPNK